MSDPAIESLLQQTTFTREEILNIKQNFDKVAASITADDKIDKMEFRQMMASQRDTVFVDALFRMFDRDGSGEVDFSEFVISLAIYQSKSKNVTDKEKLQLFFRIFDVDGDNEISLADLTTVLSSCFASNFMAVEQADVQALCQATMARYQLNAKGAITLDAYCKSAHQGRI